MRSAISLWVTSTVSSGNNGTGVAYRPDRHQYVFTGWTAPDSTSTPPDLTGWEANVGTWTSHASDHASWPEQQPAKPLVGPNPTTVSLGEMMLFPHQQRHQVWQAELANPGPFVLVTGWADLYALPLGTRCPSGPARTPQYSPTRACTASVSRRVSAHRAAPARTP